MANRLGSRWSIRAKITAMLAVPLVMLVVFWLFSVALTVPSALDLRGAGTTNDKVTVPGEALIAELQQERLVSVRYVAGGRADLTPVAAQRAKTDAALATFRRLASGSDVRGAVSSQAWQSLQATVKTLAGLVGIREAMDRGGDLDETRHAYGGLVQGAEGTLGNLAEHANVTVAQEARGVFVFSMVRELLSEEDALVTDFVREGDYTSPDRLEVVSLVSEERLLLPYAASLLPTRAQAQYAQLAAGESFQALTSLENQLIGAPETGRSPLPDIAPWRAALDPVTAQLRDFGSAADAKVVSDARSVSNGILLRLVLAGVVGLIAVVVSLVISARIGRSLVRRLGELRTASLELAEVRLPALVGRLRRGEPVNPAVEAPPLKLDGGRAASDELAQLGAAFNSVQRTAVASAVDEAAVRQGMNDVFLNIARRSQTLLHRQLSLLDTMERRTSDPDDLADLFRVDHLSTRMRRHAEDLVILAGAAPGRGWRHPVAMVDVVRGAVSEVEEYARVQVPLVGDAAVAGRAVGDVIHLLAELVENAASFSPPHTRVRISGELVPNGYVVEIEDRGLGMSEEALVEANRRLSTPPEFDPANSARLGLFVVAQLAARHGVRVSLQANPYGGVTVVVLMPQVLIVAQAEAPVPVATRHALPMDGSRSDVAMDGFAWLAPRPAESGEVSSAFRTPAPVVEAPRHQWPPLASELVQSEPVASEPEAPRALPVQPGVRAAGTRGLPRRVRQASISPQLAKDEQRVEEVAEAPTAVRTPEQMRAMMSSFQLGTSRGRADKRDDGGVAW